MHPRLSQSHVKLVTTFSLAALVAGMAPASGDDTGILGRLFRFGGSSDSSPTTGAPNQSGALPYGAPGRSGEWQHCTQRQQSVCAGADDVKLQRIAPDSRHDTAGCRWTGATIGAAAACESGRHNGRSGVDAVRTGPFQRRQPVRHVPASLRRWNRHRLGRRASPPSRRSQADRRNGSSRATFSAYGAIVAHPRPISSSMSTSSFTSGGWGG